MCQTPPHRPHPLGRLLTGGFLLALLGGCAGGGSGPVAVEASETYRGPVGAAVTPVVDRSQAALGPAGTREVQRQIATTLSGAHVFAAVFPLAQRDDGHDAEAVIAPTLLKASWAGGAGEVELQVRVSDANTGALTLERRYLGACKACPASAGGSPIAGPLAVALKDLTADLASRYGAH